jgi:hypothetical protein
VPERPKKIEIVFASLPKTTTFAPLSSEAPAAIGAKPRVEKSFFLYRGAKANRAFTQEMRQ